MGLHDSSDSVSSRTTRTIARLPIASELQSSTGADGSIWHLLRDASLSAPSPEDYASRGRRDKAFEQLLPAAKPKHSPGIMLDREPLEHTSSSLSFAGNIALNYEQFAKEAAVLARQLKEGQDIQPGDRVALLLSNGATYAISLYAVASVGAIAVNLNHRLAAEELKKQLLDTNVSAIVTDDIFEKKLGDAIAGLSRPLSIFLSPMLTVNSTQGSSLQGAQRLTFWLAIQTMTQNSSPCILLKNLLQLAQLAVTIILSRIWHREISS